jgi:hypothetical protein
MKNRDDRDLPLQIGEAISVPCFSTTEIGSFGSNALLSGTSYPLRVFVLN